MVTFFIGKEGEDEPFSVHKEFACHHSPVLNAAFNSNFIEGESQNYRLEDISASAFRFLVQWFYDQKFDVFEAKDLDCPNDKDDLDIEKLWANQDMDLIQLWIVAEKLLIRPLQNAVIVVLQGFWEGSPDDSPARHGGLGTSWIQYAYDHTVPGSSLMNFAADICAYKRFFMAIVLSEAVTLCDDEPEDEEDDDEKDENEEDDGEEDDEDAVEEDKESDESDDEEEISEDEVEGGVIEDVPIHPTYECHRAWRSYLVPEDE